MPWEVVKRSGQNKYYVDLLLKMPFNKYLLHSYENCLIASRLYGENMDKYPVNKTFVPGFQKALPAPIARAEGIQSLIHYNERSL